tara:strand:- start:435 stop:842 length:408 start_codon:yes stop_codon:yes gene_type:complete
MKKITFTKNELAAVKCCLNYDSSDDIDDDRIGQLSDNYSNGGPEEFKKLLGWNDHQVAGLISSMEQKGIGYCDTDDMAEGQTGPLFWLSEDAINAYFDLKKQQQAKAKPVVDDSADVYDYCDTNGIAGYNTGGVS